MIYTSLVLGGVLQMFDDLPFRRGFKRCLCESLGLRNRISSVFLLMS